MTNMIRIDSLYTPDFRGRLCFSRLRKPVGFQINYSSSWNLRLGHQSTAEHNEILVFMNKWKTRILCRIAGN